MGKIPWRRTWQPTPGFLPGKSHGQRSLVGYSPWGSQKRQLNNNKDWCKNDVLQWSKRGLCASEKLRSSSFPWFSGTNNACFVNDVGIGSVHICTLYIFVHCNQYFYQHFLFMAKLTRKYMVPMYPRPSDCIHDHLCCTVPRDTFV